MSDTIHTGQLNRRIITNVAMTGIALVSLVYPLVTPIIALGVMIDSIRLLRRTGHVAFKITFAITALLLIFSLIIDLFLLGGRTELGPSGPAVQ